MCKILSFLWWTSLGPSENSTRAFLGKQNWRRPPVCGFRHASVCIFITYPCVPAPRAHVETHVRVVPAYTGTFWIWMYTRRRVGNHIRFFFTFFSACRNTHAPHTKHTQTHTHQAHTTTLPTTPRPRPQRHTHNTTRRQRDRERDREWQGETEKEDRKRGQRKRTEKEREETGGTIWAQGVYDLRDCGNSDNFWKFSWRSLSIVRCTERIWRTRSTSSSHVRNERMWTNPGTKLTRSRDGKNDTHQEDVLLPVQDALRRVDGKQCRLWSPRWRDTKVAYFITVCPKSFWETRCNGRSGERERVKCTNVSFIRWS